MINVLKWSSSSKGSFRNGFQMLEFLCSASEKCIGSHSANCSKKCVPNYVENISKGTLKMQVTSNWRTKYLIFMYYFSAMLLEINSLTMRVVF